MTSFRHKSGQIFIVPDAVYGDYAKRGEVEAVELLDATAEPVDPAESAPAEKPAPKGKKKP